jgi:NAD+ diphosphatase
MAEPNTFTGVALDRAADGRRRDDDWVAAQRAHAGARVLRAGTAGIAAADGRLVLDPTTPGEDAVLLGLDAAGPLFTEDEDPPPPDRTRRPVLIGAGGRRGEAPRPSPGRFGLREAATVLPAGEAALAGYAAGLLNWHRGHRFCANCGEPTTPREAGFSRTCPRCRTEHHPRVDPVVIMLVVDGDRVLLGRQAAWPAGRYSALAGFVGPGESLEEAVAREVEEEAGVTIGPPRYSSSQPWPFPSSLMLGFEADYAGGELGGVDPELEDVRWFTRAQVRDAAGHDAAWTETGDEGSALLLPPSSAIARSLIDRWLESDIV